MTTDDDVPQRASTSRWSAVGQSVLITGRLIAVAFTVLAAAVALMLVVVGIGVVLFPACARSLHGQALGLACAHTRFTGIELRVPVIAERVAGGFTGRLRHTWIMLSSREFWRLARWALVDPFTGLLLAFMPFGLVAWGLYGLVAMPILYLLLRLTPTEWYAFIPVSSTAAVPYAMGLGFVFIVVAVKTGSGWLRLEGRWSAWLLGSRVTDLRRRVDQLATSRADARHDAAAELRRIEQEVHDGTQSQLVAIGMKLGTAEALMEDDPHRARDLIGQAREDSTTALTELRGLMRGIRPPVLADRGLGAALEALALDTMTPVLTQIHLPTRCDESLEALMYFAARELITNALKHADASHITVSAHLDGSVLAVTISDDGTGGARLVPGHGLDDMRRRLAVVDGTVVVDSPRGGPTTVRVEASCGS